MRQLFGTAGPGRADGLTAAGPAVGHTEATRSCKHLGRHCPIAAVYGGQFRIAQRDIVSADPLDPIN